MPPSAATQWKKKRLDRMLVEYFLRAGYYNTAIKLASHSGIQVLAHNIFNVNELLCIKANPNVVIETFIIKDFSQNSRK